MFFNRHVFQIRALVRCSSTQHSHVNYGGNGLNEVNIAGCIFASDFIKGAKMASSHNDFSCFKCCMSD